MTDLETLAFARQIIAAHNGHMRRLSDATALLERCRTGEATDSEIADFLSGAPAQTAAPTPEPAACPSCGYALCDSLDCEPAAPEPSADKCHQCGSTDIDRGTEHMGAVEFPESICESCFRLRYAEAQLAAVRGPYTAEDAAIVVRAWQTLSGDARDAAWEAVTLTAPSPGAGEKT